MSEMRDIREQMATNAANRAASEQAAREAAEVARRQNASQFVGPTACAAV
jgi:hypothetical protein